MSVIIMEENTANWYGFNIDDVAVLVFIISIIRTKVVYITLLS